jgi:hypothetical protein
MGPRWVPDTKTDWPTDLRVSLYSTNSQLYKHHSGRALIIVHTLKGKGDTMGTRYVSVQSPLFHYEITA